MAISLRVGLLLLTVCFLPNMLMIYLLESAKISYALTMSVIFAAASLILLFPASKIITYLIIGHELHKMNKLCKEVKDGSYGNFFELPLEQEDENELVKLKRNMNWMLHSVASREQQLQSRLTVVTKNKKEYEKMSYIDGLTGIYNRRYFDKILPECIHNCRENSFDLALVMIDCDGFKHINDTYGHQAGDDILHKLGEILKSSVRDNYDYPFRYGGDEFGIILVNIPQRNLIMVTEKIRKSFEKSNDMGCTLSIGIAYCLESDLAEAEAESIKKAADDALYKSKEEGKNQVAVNTAVWETSSD